MATVKILRKAAVIIEGTPGTYEAATTLLPVTGFSMKGETALVSDESVVGQAFSDLPVLSHKIVTGSIPMQVDVSTIGVMLEASMGYVSSGVYSFPVTSNVKSLSMAALDGVKTNKYAGLYVSKFTITSAAGKDVMFSADVIGWKAEVRDDTAFPTVTTSPGTRLVHSHASNTNGYFRIADQADALAAGDNINLESVEIGGAWQFTHDISNETISLIPLSGAGGRPEATLTFVISRHEADTFLAARDARTAMQAAFKWYSSATANMLVEVSNFIIASAEITEDDVSKITVTATLGRNGISTSYSNANMAFNSPVRVTVDNS